MKKILITLNLSFLLGFQLFCQEFPDITFDQFIPACLSLPLSDFEKFEKDPFKLSCNPGKWKPISGSGDIILDRVNGITTPGLALATGREYACTCANCIPCASANQCKQYDKNYGEGIMYVGQSFTKGKKYFLSMEYQIVKTQSPSGDIDNFLDYAGIKLSNNGQDITSQCTGSDCSDNRTWFHSQSEFTSISGQEIWNGGGNTMSSRVKIEICFTPRENYNQILFLMKTLRHSS
jgi:hypothetical protein